MSLEQGIGFVFGFTTGFTAGEEDTCFDHHECAQLPADCKDVLVSAPLQLCNRVMAVKWPIDN